MREDGIVIIATRPDSKRLPNKAFLKVADIPAIEHILQRLIGTQFQIILAVPLDCHEYDYLPGKYRDDLEIGIYNGHSESPLHRMWWAYEEVGRSQPYIIRITHDDLLIDKNTILDLLEEVKKQQAGYGITPTIVEGAGVEIIYYENLKYAAENRTQPTEFVSYFVKHNPVNKIVKARPRNTIEKPYRLTMDYYEDWLLLDTLLRKLGPFCELDKIVEYLNIYPYLLNLNKQPDITVYTCAYNSRDYVRKTIQSVLSQNYSNFEYIFIDDGSTDDTFTIASEFSSDHRMRFYKNQKNCGVADSSNLALDLAKGQYVIRVDSDDYLMMGSLSLMKDMLEQSHAGILYTAYNEINETGLVNNINIHPTVHHHAGCAMMDKRLINEIRFANGIRHWDSLELYKRIKGNFDIAYECESLWYYRIRKDSMSSQNTKERQDTLKEIQKK